MLCSYDDLHFAYDEFLEHSPINLSFNEFSMVYLIYIGIPTSQLPSYLYVSPATLSRCRTQVQRKLHVQTFEQGLLVLGQLAFWQTLNKFERF